jgi:hypothetical protein
MSTPQFRAPQDADVRVLRLRLGAYWSSPNMQLIPHYVRKQSRSHTPSKQRNPPNPTNLPYNTIPIRVIRAVLIFSYARNLQHMFYEFASRRGLN